MITATVLVFIVGYLALGAVLHGFVYPTEPEMRGFFVLVWPVILFMETLISVASWPWQYIDVLANFGILLRTKVDGVLKCKLTK